MENIESIEISEMYAMQAQAGHGEIICVKSTVFFSALRLYSVRSLSHIVSMS